MKVCWGCWEPSLSQRSFTCNIRQFGRLLAGHVVVVEVHHDDPSLFFLQRWTEEETLNDLETGMGWYKSLSLLLCQAGGPIAAEAEQEKGPKCRTKPSVIPC